MSEVRFKLENENSNSGAAIVPTVQFATQKSYESNNKKSYFKKKFFVTKPAKLQTIDLDESRPIFRSICLAYLALFQ